MLGYFFDDEYDTYYVRARHYSPLLARWLSQDPLFYPFRSYRHRYYHGQLGRFGSRDPIGYEGSQWNLYEYVGGNAVVRLDPEGTISPGGGGGPFGWCGKPQCRPGDEPPGRTGCRSMFGKPHG